MFRKNVAGQFIHVQGVDSSTGGIKSGVTWTVRRCIDGTFAAAAGTATEDGSTGWYKFALSQADTNGNNIGFNFTGTGAIPQTVNIVTTALDPTSTAFGLVLAKTTNITGFNDIAATAVVSSGAITTSGGAVSTVSAVTGLTASNLDATISSRATPAQVNTEADTALADVGLTTTITGRIDAAMSTRASQTSVDDLPTNTELTTALDAADDAVLAAVAALNNLSAAEVNAEVVDALAADTYAEPGQGAPLATTSLAAKINYLYKSWRNKKDNDGTTTNLYADDATTVDQKQTTSESGGTVTKAEWITGP